MRLAWEVDRASLIGDWQFGSRHHYSAPDVALSLAYKAREVITHRRIGAVILFDISRFFDNISPDLTCVTLTDLGVNLSTITWIRSFIKDRIICMNFNDFTSDPFHPSHGTPQGSPLSPILSALVTSPLLQRCLDLKHTDLMLYVDNGCIFRSGPTFLSASVKVIEAFSLILTLLHRMGLEVDADKTELMFFTPPCPSPHYGTQPLTVTIPLQGGKTLTIRPSTSLCYPRVFFTPKLDWCLHVTTMANRMHSTVKALGVLGSLVRGISLLS